MNLRPELHHFMPRLWAFAYPLNGRGMRPLRRLAARVWADQMKRHALALDAKHPRP